MRARRTSRCVECAPSAGPIELDELRSLGAELRDAYERVLRARPGTAAYAAAWANADRATQRLGVLVGDHTSTSALRPGRRQQAGREAHNLRL
jgi:hypothetical protein